MTLIITFFMGGELRFLKFTGKKINSWGKVQNDWKMFLTNHDIFLSPLISRNEAMSMGFFFHMSTVIYTQNKFRWSYSGSLGVTGSPFVRDYYSRRLPRRGINLPWNNTSHNNSKELVSALLMGCAPAQGDFPTELIKPTCSFMWQSQPSVRN